jgi:hypothetical protein
VRAVPIDTKRLRKRRRSRRLYGELGLIAASLLQGPFGLSDITLDGLLPIYESARIKPAVVQVEAHPYLPETELLEFCKKNDIVFLALLICGKILSLSLLF